MRGLAYIDHLSTHLIFHFYCCLILRYCLDLDLLVFTICKLTHFSLVIFQPQMFLKLRSELASMWMPSSRAGSFRKVSARADLPLLDKDSSTCYHNMPVTTTDEATNMKASILNGG